MSFSSTNRVILAGQCGVTLARRRTSYLDLYTFNRGWESLVVRLKQPLFANHIDFLENRTERSLLRVPGVGGRHRKNQVGINEFQRCERSTSSW